MRWVCRNTQSPGHGFLGVCVSVTLQSAASWRPWGPHRFLYAQEAHVLSPEAGLQDTGRQVSVQPDRRAWLVCEQRPHLPGCAVRSGPPAAPPHRGAGSGAGSHQALTKGAR